jgi:transcriptional regulator
MLAQEEYMDVLQLRHQGFTITEIADELGYHPATISRWIEAGGPPSARQTDRGELLTDEHWARRIELLLEANRRL